jgi:hypothetical protein
MVVLAQLYRVAVKASVPGGQNFNPFSNLSINQLGIRRTVKEFRMGTFASHIRKLYMSNLSLAFQDTLSGSL